MMVTESRGSGMTKKDSMTIPRPAKLLDRPMDVVYLVYFAIHLLASLLIDAQLVFPPYSQTPFPVAVQKVLKDYMHDTRDPFLLAALIKAPSHVWFRTLLASEALLQIPCFFVGIWGLWTNEKKVYPVLIAYGTLASSSTLQCICSLLLGSDGASLTHGQIRGLLQNYVPFCLIPTFLTIDMMLRTTRLMSAA